MIGAPVAGGTILIGPNTGAVPVAVSINGVAQQIPAPPSTIGHIIVYGQGGNDMIKETGSIGIGAILFGGGGTNLLSVAGSSADNILVGGPGKNTLVGGNSRDILIGGVGAARLNAGTGGDILIGGSTTYDANLPALLALMAEWGSDDVYQQRVQDLFGDGAGGRNGSYLLNPQTVIRDSALSQLFGGSGSDWFWFSDSKKARDRIGKYADGEVATFE
jgi:Ca2+-binding RTX toxin-like protein